MARVYVSTVVNARNDRVWARVRDFNGLPNWHPAIAESRIEGGEPADKIGCVRDFRLRNGDRIREKLLGLSDYDMFCTYSILESPMGVENYVATLRLTPVTDGDQTFLEWTAEFDCAPERETELVGNIGGGVFQGGFDALKRAFGGWRCRTSSKARSSMPRPMRSGPCCATSTDTTGGIPRSRPPASSARRPPTRSVACG